MSSLVEQSRRDCPGASAASLGDKQAVWKLVASGLGFLAEEADDDVKRLNDGNSLQQKTTRLQPLQSKDNGDVWKKPGQYCRSVSTDSEVSDDEFDLRPLIKEELRNTIKKRRWQRGLLDWGLEDYDKKRCRDNQLTPEELKQREDRKRRNRLAAAKCREKRRKRQNELQKTMDNLEMRRSELMQLKENLRREKQELQQMVEEHFRLCRPDRLRET